MEDIKRKFEVCQDGKNIKNEMMVARGHIKIRNINYITFWAKSACVSCVLVEVFPDPFRVADIFHEIAPLYSEASRGHKNS